MVIADRLWDDWSTGSYVIPLGNIISFQKLVLDLELLGALSMFCSDNSTSSVAISAIFVNSCRILLFTNWYKTMTISLIKKGNLHGSRCNAKNSLTLELKTSDGTDDSTISLYLDEEL